MWFLYAMGAMGCAGTLYSHRYVEHQAFTFSDNLWGKFWRLAAQNLVVKVVPEELFAISHHVHHAIHEQPGDPYSFSSDANHQPIALDLTPFRR